MKNTTFSSISLRSILVIAVILSISSTAGAFYIIQNSFSKTAKEIASTVTTLRNNNDNSATSNSKLSNDQTEQEKEAILKSQKITYADDNAQIEIKEDIDKYAADNQMIVSDIKYDSTINPLLKNPVQGANANTATITISNPVKYSDLIKFIKGIESNLPKISILGINISKDPSLSEKVNVDPLIISYYTR